MTSKRSGGLSSGTSRPSHSVTLRAWAVLISVSAVVEAIYADVARSLWPAARQSTLAALAKLEAQGRVQVTDDNVRLLG